MMSKHDRRYETVTPDGQKIIMVDGPSEIASWVFPHEPEDGMKPSAQQKHPRADATCRIVPITDSAYQIAVAIPDMMTSFATEDAAQAGIAEHEWQVESGSIVLKRTKPTKAPAS